MIFDTHAHYDDDAFDEDRDTLLSGMKEAGVEYIVNVGASMASSARSVALAEKYPFVYAAVGVHPDEVGELNEENFEQLRNWSKLEKVKAIGEIGLDYYWDKEKHDLQKHWFMRQMELAHETNLPMIVHSREAAKDTLDMVIAAKPLELSGIIHCYSYSVEQAREYYAGENVTYLLTFDLFKEKEVLSDEEKSEEYHRLTGLGYKLYQAKYWTYNENDEKVEHPIIVGLFTEEELANFDANDMYGYAFRFVTNEDNSGIHVDESDLITNFHSKVE